jgi:hypothetical protein
MCYLGCGYVMIVIVIVLYGGKVHVAATECFNSAGVSALNIVTQEEFFTEGIQEKIILKIPCRMFSSKCHEVLFYCCCVCVCVCDVATAFLCVI